MADATNGVASAPATRPAPPAPAAPKQKTARAPKTETTGEKKPRRKARRKMKRRVTRRASTSSVMDKVNALAALVKLVSKL